MIKIFIHICTIGEYQKIFEELMTEIINHDLINHSIINVCITGTQKLDEKYNINYNYLGDSSNWEFPTLKFIEDNIDIGDKILYIHNFGSTGDSIFKQSWRKYLIYFNIKKWKDCIKALDSGYDTCGVDYRTDPTPHYSGNFWWANAAYLKTLPKIETLNKQDSPRVLTLRHNAEMYIGINTNIKPRILHQSNISQYSRHLYLYSENNYIDKISEQDIIIHKGEIE